MDWQCFREAEPGSISERPSLAVFQRGREVWPGSVSERPSLAVFQRGRAWQCFKEAEHCGLQCFREAEHCGLSVFQRGRQMWPGMAY